METIKTSMKWLLGMVLGIALVTSCKKDNPSNSQGSVVFKVQAQAASNLKKIKTGTEPVAAAIIVSIEKQGGGVVYNKEKLELSYLNGTYLTKGLPLPVGNYNLTEFLVADTGNRIIYATPKSGSDLARLVSNPLPISFSAQAGIESILVPEVIATDSSSLKDFGYEGFSFNPVKTTNFLITILSKDPQSQNFEQVDSVNFSLWGRSGNYTRILKRGVNVIALPLISDPSYEDLIIYVWKLGYTSSMIYWNPIMDRLNEYANTPLQIVLTPINGPYITFFGYNGGVDYNGPSVSSRSVHTFYADYGDGHRDTVTGNSFTFSRGQDFPGYRLLQIWGDVQDISSVSVGNPPKSFQETIFDRVDLRGASTIEGLNFYYGRVGEILMNKATLKGYSSLFSTVDFSFEGCSNIESITSWDGRSIDVSTNNKLKSISTDGTSFITLGDNPVLVSINMYNDAPSFPFSKETVESLLPDLLKSVKKYPRSGDFSTSSYESYTLSTQAMQIVDTLKLNYNWTFNFIFWN